VVRAGVVLPLAVFILLVPLVAAPIGLPASVALIAVAVLLAVGISVVLKDAAIRRDERLEATKGAAS
jgi:hypothetical protein